MYGKNRGKILQQAQHTFYQSDLQIGPRSRR